MNSNTTLPRLLHRNAAHLGRRPAMREKHGGIWQVTSWSAYAALVSRIAASLAARGFGRGDKLAVIGDNRLRLYAAMLAAQSLGGAAVPLWPDAEPEWIAQVLDHAEVSVVVAEDAEQVEKLAAIRDRLPGLRLVVQATSHGMAPPELDWLTSFDTLIGAANAVAAIDSSEPGELAILLYGTGGVDGDVRGVMLSHANLLAAADALLAAEDVRETDETLAWLPMAWFGDALTTLALSLAAGFTCNCPEDLETARRDLREIGPTILLAPPRIWENTLADIEARARQASRLKRALFTRFRALAERAEQMREAGESLPLTLRIRLALGEVLIFAPVRDLIGFRRLRWANTCGETLAPHVLRFFRALGVDLKQSYGMAESAGLVAVQQSPCAGLEISVAADGEVLLGGASVCLGYYRDPARTQQALTEDGRWRTGDAGDLDAEGRLTIRDRIAHLGVLADGTSFAPRLIEDALRHSAFIQEALVLGHDRHFVAAMIAIDPVTVGAWAQDRNLGFASHAELAASAEVRQLIREEIRLRNAGLPQAARVRRFLLLERAPPAASMEASLSRALRRQSALAANAALVQSLFQGRPGGIAPTEVPDDIIVLIEEVDQPGTAMWEPAHA
jgi:long-chain acyl-CoA synthetase